MDYDGDIYHSCTSAGCSCCKSGDDVSVLCHSSIEVGAGSWPGDGRLGVVWTDVCANGCAGRSDSEDGTVV